MNIHDLLLSLGLSELHGGEHKHSLSAEPWLPSRSVAAPYQEQTVCILLPHERVEQNSHSYCLCSYPIFFSS